MYFLIDNFTRPATITPHQTWVLVLLVFFALILSGAAMELRHKDGAWDLMLVINALFLWALVFDRFMISVWYQYLLYDDYQKYYPVYTAFRHLSLLCIEFPLYALAFLLLAQPIKKWLKERLKGWLKDV